MEWKALTAKRKSFNREVYDGVIDNHGAAGGAGLEGFSDGLDVGEHVQTGKKVVLWSVVQVRHILGT